MNNEIVEEVAVCIQYPRKFLLFRRLRLKGVMTKGAEETARREFVQEGIVEFGVLFWGNRENGTIG
jgi:hypothetical protein